jgi:fucose permease
LPNAEIDSSTSHTYWQLITSRWTIWAWVAAILIGYVEWGHTYWFVNYAHQGRGIGLDNARWGLLAFTAGMVLARAWQTFIHSSLSTEQRLVRLGWIGCVMFALIAWFPNPTLIPYVLTINFFAGVGIGIVFPILLNHLIDFAPHDTAKFSALLMFGIIIGAQLAGLVIGYLADTFSINLGYASIAVAMFGFTFATLRLFAVHKHHPSSKS